MVPAVSQRMNRSDIHRVRMLPPCQVAAQRPFFDRTHQSQVFGEPRHYRIFLPPDYASSKQAYPVIYYFHGHSDRHTLEKYDNGADTTPKIAAFVAAHPVIVVAVDGYVARDYTGFYGGSPFFSISPGAAVRHNPARRLRAFR